MKTLLNIVNRDIADYIGTPALLEQCAEECSELNQACLKMARKLRDENPTPKTVSEIRENLKEEIADVLLSMDYIMFGCNLEMEDLTSTMAEKQVRWIKRINEQIEEEKGEE